MVVELGQIFGRRANLYDKFRPCYAKDMFDFIGTHLFDLSVARVLEVGAGTGLATGELIARGAKVSAVEPDESMAALLAEKFPEIVIARGRFEQIELEAGIFDLVFSAQAWHWIDPEIGLDKAALVLCEGGYFTAAWNLGSISDPQVASALAKRVTLPQDTNDLVGESIKRLHRRLLVSRWFENPNVTEFEHTVHYSRSGFVSLMATMSSVIALGDDEQLRLYRAIQRCLPDELDLTYRTVLVWSRRARVGTF
jgi:SAM-dependent methyltransferase